MDFFGNVQNVEMQGDGEQGRWNETAWKEDLEHLKKLVEAAQQRHNASSPAVEAASEEATIQAVPLRKQKAAKVAAEDGLGKQIVGAAALLGCVGVWLAASYLEGGK